jgi:hypothetical protein
VAANFFTVTGATSATNTADSGVVAAVFPATAVSSPGGGGGGGGAAVSYTPAVQTEAASIVTADSAVLNGNITSDSGYVVTDYGFLWGTSSGSLTNKLDVGTNNLSGAFTATLSSLTAGTTYYFQAYATNSQGTADGAAVMSFTTTGSAQTTTPVTSTAPVFSDVSASYWAYGAISSLSSQGLVSGYPDGTFKPGGAITRAELVSIIGKALKLQSYSPAAPDFSDVSSSDWFYGSVESTVYAGIIKGEGNGAFGSNQPITRQELACILANALGKQDEAIVSASQQSNFTDDASISSWARGSVAVVVKYGLLKGYPDGSFKPQGDATRAEACAMITGFLNMQQ